MKNSSTIFVYFHGYGSNGRSPKVDQLRSTFTECEVYSFDIDIDPRVSIPYLMDCIYSILLEDPHAEKQLVFIGTSLGAWYASVLGKMYAAKRILINPAMTPSTSLLRYGVDKTICDEYSDLRDSGAFYILASGDEVFDSTKTFDEVTSIGAYVHCVNGYDHRFAGQIFTDSVKTVLDTQNK